MLTEFNPQDKFIDYYEQWIKVYKENAVREVTMEKYSMSLTWLKKLISELTMAEMNRKTGLRYAEALAVTPGDFDFAQQTLTISKTWNYKGEGGFQPTKTRASMRKIKIDWRLVTQFATLCQGREKEEPLFVEKKEKYKAVYNSTANSVLERHWRKLGLPVVSVHGLRHTHASLLLYAGVSIASVARRLGHSDMSITEKIYLHIIQELENQDVDLVMRSLANLT